MQSLHNTALPIAFPQGDEGRVPKPCADALRPCEPKLRAGKIGAIATNQIAPSGLQQKGTVATQAFPVDSCFVFTPLCGNSLVLSMTQSTCTIVMAFSDQPGGLAEPRRMMLSVITA